MEGTAALIILVPILLQITKPFGIHPVHLGTIVVLNLMIGLVTPPVGLCLYIACNIAKRPIEKVSKALCALPDSLVRGADAGDVRGTHRHVPAEAFRLRALRGSSMKAIVKTDRSAGAYAVKDMPVPEPGPTESARQRSRPPGCATRTCRS